MNTLKLTQRYTAVCSPSLTCFFSPDPKIGMDGAPGTTDVSKQISFQIESRHSVAIPYKKLALEKAIVKCVNQLILG